MGGRHTVRALSQEVWSSRLAVVNPARSLGHRAICARPRLTGQRRLLPELIDGGGAGGSMGG